MASKKTSQAQPLQLPPSFAAATFDCPPWPPPNPDALAAVTELFSSGDWGCYQAEVSRRLHDQMARDLSVRHVRLVCSGSAAIELALRGCSVGMPQRPVAEHRQAASDPAVRPAERSTTQEVICPALDYPGNVRAVRLLGAQPVLVDSVPGGWTIDPEAVVAAGTQRTAAVIASHLYGEVAAVGMLRQICDQHGWMLIEDVCQMPGGRLDGRPLGSFGHAAAWSFGGSKPLTAGCGGAITTDDDRIAQRLASHIDRPSDGFPLSPLQAAVLLPQWMALNALAARQRARLERLRDACYAKTPWWQWPPVADRQHQPVFYKLPIVVQADAAVDNPLGQLIAAAQACGVPAGEPFRIPRATASFRGRIDSAAQAQAITARAWLIDHRVLAGEDAHVDRLAEVLIGLHQRLYDH